MLAKPIFQQLCIAMQDVFCDGEGGKVSILICHLALKRRERATPQFGRLQKLVSYRTLAAKAATRARGAATQCCDQGALT